MANQVYDVERDFTSEQPLQIQVSTLPDRRTTGETIALLAKAGLATGVAILAFGVCSGRATDVEKEATMHELTVTKLEPIEIDCRARLIGTFANQTSLNPTAFGFDLASDYKVNTNGEAETLSCAKASDVKVIISKSGDQDIFIPTDSISFWTRTVENNTNSVAELDATAEVGKAAWQIVEAVTPFTGLNKKLNQKIGDLTQTGREYGANQVQENCGQAAWSITEDVIQEGYELSAKRKGVDPAKVHTHIITSNGQALPNFSGPYKLNKDFKYKTLGSNPTCKIADGARIPVISKPVQAKPTVQ